MKLNLEQFFNKVQQSFDKPYFCMNIICAECPYFYNDKQQCPPGRFPPYSKGIRNRFLKNELKVYLNKKKIQEILK